MNEELGRIPKKRKQKKLFRIVFLVLLLLVLGSVVGVLLSENYFIVREVQFQETELYSYDTLFAAAGVEIGRPMAKTSKKEIEKNLLAACDFLTDIQVDFSFTGTVTIRFTESLGDFCVQLGSENFAVKGDLYVLSRGVDPGDGKRILLLSSGVKTCIAGEKMTFLDESLEAMIPEIISALEEKEMRADVQTLDLRDKFNIRIRYLDRFDVLLGENENIAYKLAMLRQVVRKLDPDVTGQIDLADANTAYVNAH